MLVARRVAPFVYVILGVLSALIWGEKVSGAVWIVGALALAALYSLTRGQRSSNPERAAARQARRGR